MKKVHSVVPVGGLGEEPVEDREETRQDALFEKTGRKKLGMKKGAVGIPKDPAPVRCV